MPVMTDADLLELARAVAARAQAGGLTLATAESCTGGWIAKVLTDLAGSSGWFEGGVVSYSNALKQQVLGVRAHTLAAHGAVSEATALEMVQGALRSFGVSAAVAVTGVAGPGGGTQDKPVGTVWIGWQRAGQPARAERFQFDGDREAVRRQTVAAALAGLRRLLTD